MSKADDSTGKCASLANTLNGVNIVSIALNLPGPAAVMRLSSFGAFITKIEPPDGDPLQAYSPAYYSELHEGIKVRRIDLKNSTDYASFSRLLDETDLLITAQRPDALARFKLDWNSAHARWPSLSIAAILGHAVPHQNKPGHDLTYIAEAGLIIPPHLPPTLMADLLGAERAVSTSLALLHDGAKNRVGRFAEVHLEEAAYVLSGPLRHGLTARNGIVGGGDPGYQLYQTQDGWIALAALEDHFLHRVVQGLDLDEATIDKFRAAFRKHSTAHWLAWAGDRDIPLAAVG
jgi:crotonobetainyl-CoA:carnitine CoA-transferase CaiB-like acyl-CoA transferase